MRLKFAATAVALMLLTSLATLVVRDTFLDEAASGHGAVQTLVSTRLGEARSYEVFLPEHYGADGNRRYPVLYVLDGQSQGEHTAASAALMARIGIMPEVIVVGIPSGSSETRNRDYTPADMRIDDEEPGGALGSADRFLGFVEEELVPAVEREYRTRRPRMLSGWSRGGLLVVYSLLTQPAFFDARFAQSPALWREDNRIIPQAVRALGAPTMKDQFLFLSLGAKENAKMTSAFNQLTAALEQQAPPALRWRSVLSHDGDHETNPRLATPIGLCAFFAPAAAPGAAACQPRLE